MQDERGTTHLDGGEYSSSRGLLMNENLPPSVEAAVRLENRLTRIEAAQQAAHTSIDALLSAIGEIKGIMLDRFKNYDAAIAGTARDIEAQKDAYNLHITEVETIGSR